MRFHEDTRSLRLRAFASVFLLAAAAPLQAAPPGAAHIPTDGDRLPKGVASAPAVVAQCLACHGPSGNSDYADWPSLAGQKESYLLEQLKAYKSGARKHPMMQPAVAPLGAADLPKLAAYFSAQRATQSAAPATGAVKSAVSGSAALCMACHDNPAVPDPPFLRAQKADYLVRQLHAFRDGTRKSSVMEILARPLSDSAIDELAAHFSALPAVHTAARK